jgi:hypothetical protein
MIADNYLALVFFIMAVGSGSVLLKTNVNIERAFRDSEKKYERNFLWQNKAFRGFPKTTKEK